MEILGILAALVAGAGGNKLGKSPLTGEKPLNKVLAPVGALAAGLVYTKVTGNSLPADQVMFTGTTIAASAVGIYSAGKNLFQLFTGKD